MSLCQMPPKFTVSCGSFVDRDDLGEAVDALHERVLHRLADAAARTRGTSSASSAWSRKNTTRCSSHARADLGDRRVVEVGREVDAA